MSLEQYIVVRYYESEYPDKVDVIRFQFPSNASNAKIRDLRKELEDAWNTIRTMAQAGNVDVDICAACDIIVKKHGGDYTFPVFNHLPLELK